MPSVMVQAENPPIPVPIPAPPLTPQGASDKDRLYAEPREGDFTFDAQVAAVFPDMAQRSIPGYRLLIDEIGNIAARYAQPYSAIYDLGASHGACALSMGHQVEAGGVRIFAVDSSPDMIEHLNKRPFQGLNAPITSVVADIETLAFEPSSVIVSNFCMQFVERERRVALLESIYNSLKPGGVFILSEKVDFEQGTTQTRNRDLHHRFKRRNGYSELEVSRKREALEQVMRLDSIPAHLRRLHTVGFEPIDVWFRCYNFISMLAFKS